MTATKGTSHQDKPGLAARTTATTLLTRVIDDGRGLDGLLDTRHGPASYRELSIPDKALVRAIATTAFRHRGEIEFALNAMLDRKLPKNARHLIHTLHTAATQILFLDVPDSAAVDLAVTALRNDKRSTRFAGLANAILRRLSREKEELFSNQAPGDLAVMNMAPWLRTRTRKSYGKERLSAIASQHMLEPVIDLTVKSNPGEWAQKLGGIPLFGNSIRVNQPGKIEEWEGYDNGKWWVQDCAASLPAYLLGEIANKHVLDLCAAPGGKTAQLAAMGAQVTALEASQPRLDRLLTNMNRLQLTVTGINADLFEWQSGQLFDAILLDAPCSSTGTIRRHPDVQWTKSPQIINDLAKIQHDMIVRAADFLKPGGTLVFANCSLDRAEGEDVYSKIIKNQPHLQSIPISPSEIYGMSEIITGQGTVRTLPSHLQSVVTVADDSLHQKRMTGMDGFFAARFTKQN